MKDEIQYDDTPRRAGRWATATSILGALGLLIGAAFANQFAARLGIPTMLSYGLAGLGAVAIILLNAGIGSNLSRTIYGAIVVGLLVVLAILTAMGCALAYVDDGASDQSLISMGLFTGIFVATALTAWRLKVLVGQL